MWTLKVKKIVEEISTAISIIESYVGKISIQNFNVVLEREARQIRKTWRPLPHVVIPGELSFDRLARNLCLGAIHAVSKSGKSYFSFSIGIVDSHYKGLYVQHVYAPSSDFIAGLEYATTGALRARRDETLDSYLDEMTDLLRGWSLGGELSTGGPIVGCSVTADAKRKSIVLGSFPDWSPRIRDYKHKLTTTSEIIKFIVGASKRSLLLIDDPFDNLSLCWFKVLACLAEKKQFRLNDFEVNVDDEEEWDFHYTEY
jgi:hypothetical protein